MNSKQELKNASLIEGFFIKVFFDLMALIPWLFAVLGKPSHVLLIFVIKVFKKLPG